MRNNQKAKLKQPVIALLLNSQENARKTHSRQPSQAKSRKPIKIIHSKSDNRESPKVQNRFPHVRSQKIITKQSQKIQQFNQYGMRRNNQEFKSQKIIDNKNNQCLRDEDQSSHHEQIMSHYRRSKSRYKNAKDKAKKLIENLRNQSKNHCNQQSQYQTQNQDYFKVIEKNKELNHNKPSAAQDYQMEIRSIGKASCSSSFRQKKQKSSTIKWKKEELSKVLKKSSLNMDQHAKSVSKAEENKQKQKADQKSSTRKQKNQQNTTITNTTSVGSSNNLFVAGQNMVVKAKDLLSAEYGIGNYSDKKKNNLESVAQNNVQTLSQKLLTTQRSQKDSQRILRHSRQKNKKIIGKLRQKTSFLKVPDYSQKLDPAKYNTNSNNIFKTPQKGQIKQKSMIQETSMLEGNYLMLNSKLNSTQTNQNQQIKQKILIHLQTLNMIGDYAQSFRSIYDDCEEWQQLIFLLYKKYYIERAKIFMIMKNGCIKFDDFISKRQKHKNQENSNECKLKNVQTQSPFVFNFCKVSLDELNSFRQSKQQISLQLQVQNYNKSIKVALRQLYNQFIQKTSQNSCVNMYQVDDFSQQIIQDLNEQINMLIQSSGKSKILKKRINLAIQIGLIVAHLGGYHLEQIQEIVTAQVQKSSFYKKYYSRFMRIFEQNEESSQGNIG